MKNQPEKLSEAPDPENTRKEIYAETEKLIKVRKDVRATEEKLTILLANEERLTKRVEELTRIQTDLDRAAGIYDTRED